MSESRGCRQDQKTRSPSQYLHSGIAWGSVVRYNGDLLEYGFWQTKIPYPIFPDIIVRLVRRVVNTL